MSTRIVRSLLILLTASTVFASDPGEPMGDCEDWVTSAGISCELVVPYPCMEPVGVDHPMCGIVGMDAPNNEGGIFTSRRVSLDGSSACQLWDECCRIEIWEGYRQMAASRLVAYLNERCEGSNQEFLQYLYLQFDEEAGILYAQSHPASDLYPGDVWGHTLVAFTPFTTSYEVQQTYTPSAGGFSFRSPVMPEGLAAVDHYDTYFGDLARVGDWSSASPLSCDYPATPPKAGQSLFVADTLPRPAPGTGYWYVTAATSPTGETRYGRKTADGILTGRDAVLPPCNAHRGAGVAR